MIAWWWLPVAVFVGAIVGAIVAGWCAARRTADDAAEAMYRGE